MKTMDIKQLHTQIDQTQSMLNQSREKLDEMKKAVESLLESEEIFTGEAAESVRTFYRETHLPLQQYVLDMIENYDANLRKIRMNLYQIEPSDNGWIDEDFLRRDVEQSLKKAGNVTMSLTDSVNRSLSSIRDIVSIPNLDDQEFHENIRNSRRHVLDTVDKMYDFDHNASNILNNQFVDIKNVNKYMSELNGLLTNRDISVGTYEAKQLFHYEFHQEFIERLKRQG
ncbi:ribonuclease YeeF family protein [Oceanobacillus sp. 1P07AA]|uniref:ribonuclease YeeF family protein n=1 Tax=Oceanobacillus sp. 1P07AA TaxID=3132293 RepID=UPI0039A706AD